MTGKSKCKILKEIRQQIARDNDIELVTSECKYQGDCTGTCPKCEAELRYLENELAKRQQMGKAVAVAGIAATFVLGAAGCYDSGTLPGAPLPPDIQGGMIGPYEEELQGEPTVAMGETMPTLMGDVEWTDPTEKEWMGAVPLPEE